VELINYRNANHSRVATDIRGFSSSAAAWHLPLFRLTSLRVSVGAAPLPFVLGVVCVLWATIFEFAVAKNGTFAPGPINSRNATRSRVAILLQSFSISEMTSPLPLFRLTSPGCAHVQCHFPFRFEGAFLFFGRPQSSFVEQQDFAAGISALIFIGVIAATLSLPLSSPSSILLFSQMRHKFFI